MKEKMRKAAGFCLIGLAVLLGVAAALALAGRLVYPYSFAPAVLAGLIVAGMLLRLWLKVGSVKGRVLRGASWVLVLAVLWGITVGAYNISSGPRGEEYSSPAGENTVIVEYSFMGVPKVYLKRNWLLRSPVAVEAGPGLMESVAYEVRWEAEDMLVLDLGLCKGALEWYAIDLIEMRGVWNRVLLDEDGRSG